jgi:glyoxalase family protein
MVHRIVFRVASSDALDFWEKRLSGDGLQVERQDTRLAFMDPEGLSLELRVVSTGDEPLIAEHPEIPRELAVQGFDGVRAYSADPERSRSLLEGALGFTSSDEGWEVRGDRRGSLYVYDGPPDAPGIQGAGTVHHVAFASTIEDHPNWRDRVIEGGAHPTPVIDRFYFRSIYFREPSGVLFEIATLGPGFAIDEDPEHLGEKISLPPPLEHLRERIEPALTPLTNPRQNRVQAQTS